MWFVRAILVLGFAIGSPAFGWVYRVGVGDVLTVSVLGEKEFSGSFRIATDGAIDYPFLRKINVNNKTTEELETLLTERLKEGYLTDPQVSVEVKEYHSQEVLLFGAVGRPGPYVLTEETRILDLVSRAGGITAAGGKRLIILRREKDPKETPVVKAEAIKEKDPKEDPSVKAEATEVIVIDYYNLVHKGDFSQNLVMKNGDIVNVPRANEVLISGNVGRPGPLKYEEGMTPLQAIMIAGDTTVNASAKSTYILRKEGQGDSKIEVRLDKIKDGKEKDFPLKADDIVVVPESFF
jgi:polysaccharide export outer membrane protein